MAGTVAINLLKSIGWVSDSGTIISIRTDYGYKVPKKALEAYYAKV